MQLQQWPGDTFILSFLSVGTNEAFSFAAFVQSRLKEESSFSERCQ